MPFDQTTVFFVGILIGGILLAMGGWLGFRFGLGRSPAVVPSVDVEAAELLSMLEQLTKWTSEYSGNVSRYQSDLDHAAKAVRQSSVGGENVSPVIQVLDDIMTTNRSLQQRLEDAERQLDKQTKDIEAYLHEANTDALTTLPNRRAFDRRLDELFSGWRKGGHGFVFVMIDIDHFKQVNDRYGHPEGDLVLRQVGKLLKEQLEGAYIAARFGGEEFAVLLPMPLRVAAERMNRLRKVLGNEPIPIDDRVSLDVTISVGLSETRGDKVVGPVVRRADEALYAAKGLGRNRVYYHDGRQPILVGAPEVAV